MEIHVPISPTSNFFTMVHYLAASLRRLGTPMAEVPLVVTVGADCEPFDLKLTNPWSARYPIRWVWLDRELFRQKSFYATAVERFRMTFEAPCVAMLDADLVVLRDLSGLVDAVRTTGAVHGLIAHVSPFWVENRARPEIARSNADWWDGLYRAAGLGSVEYRCQHTGWGMMFDGVMFDDPEYRYCPPYFNLGVVIGPAEAMSRIGETIYREMAHVESVLETIFKCQLALSLALKRLDVPHRELHVRDNFPKLEAFWRSHGADVNDIRILHYLGQDDSFRKSTDMADVDAVQRFLLREGVSSSSAALQKALIGIQAIVDADLDVCSGDGM